MKQLPVICFLFAFINFLHGQPGFGIRAGANMASTSADDAMRIGFHAGILNNFPLTPKLYGQAEISFTQKGFADGGQFIQSFDFLFIEQRFDYVAAGFVLGYKVLDNFSLQIGAEGSYLVNARTVMYQQVFKGAAGMDKFDFSLTAGMQSHLRQVGIYARYIHGFADMRDFSLTDINGLFIGKGEVGTLQTFQVGVSFTGIMPRASSSKDKVSPRGQNTRGAFGTWGRRRK